MKDSVIEYGYFSSPLGEMIGGRTKKGFCFLEWQDRGSVARILERVRKRYKMNTVEGDPKEELFGRLQEELNRYFSGQLENFTVPIDVNGTSFENSVWSELRKIPYGQRRSYAQIAASIGNPGGVRAVGRANGANYLAIVIPCHRVVQADGALGGYGGKVWRKKHLLELESGATPEILSSTTLNRRDTGIR